MRFWSKVHGAVAALIAVTFPLGVWWVNGALPPPAIILGLALGLTYYWTCR